MAFFVAEIAVGPLAQGVPTTVAHGLAQAPDIVMPDTATPIRVVSVSATSIVFENLDAAPASATFRAQITYSIHQRGLGAHLWQGFVPAAGGASPTVCSPIPLAMGGDLNDSATIVHGRGRQPIVQVVEDDGGNWADATGDVDVTHNGAFTETTITNKSPNAITVSVVIL